MSYEAWGDNDEPSVFDAAIEAGWINPVDQTKALIDMMNERDRQWNEEGWTPEHDDQHVRGELAKAAASYAQSAVVSDAFRADFGPIGPPLFWPFPREWYKPTTQRRDLIKAGALILAEIERLDRAAAKAA